MPIASIARHITPDDLVKQLHADVARGLSARPRSLPSKWLYDARGSELFERITELDEYYPTRAERAILATRAGAIAADARPAALVELGSGSSEKTRLLLDALTGVGTLARYVAVDVSESALTEAAERIAADYPGLAVHGVVDDFTHTAEALPETAAGTAGGRLFALLGGTIGNLAPGERVSFLARLAGSMAAGDALLLGTDLVKDPARLLAAYDDAAGVTAEFNRNVLGVLNRNLGADFDVGQFEHVAAWDPEREWIQMRLRARADQLARIPALEMAVPFVAGEEVRTEISAKFRRERVVAELGEAGLALRRWWTDPAGDFALSLAVPAAADPG